MGSKTSDKGRNDADAGSGVSDATLIGHPDLWYPIHRFSSASGRLTRSTEVMKIGTDGCLVRVFSQRRNPDGRYVISEAVTFVPGPVFDTFLCASGRKEHYYTGGHDGWAEGVTDRGYSRPLPEESVFDDLSKKGEATGDGS